MRKKYRPRNNPTTPPPITTEVPLVNSRTTAAARTPVRIVTTVNGIDRLFAHSDASRRARRHVDSARRPSVSRGAGGGRKSRLGNRAVHLPFRAGRSSPVIEANGTYRCGRGRNVRPPEHQVGDNFTRSVSATVSNFPTAQRYAPSP